MRKDIITEDGQGRVEMRGLVVSDDIDEFNADERKIIGRGFTLGRTMRKVANIDPDELAALCAKGDKDALDFLASGYASRRALKKLLHRFPAWRCSEGCL
jgi:hypothetical protein